MGLCAVLGRSGSVGQVGARPCRGLVDQGQAIGPAGSGKAVCWTGQVWWSHGVRVKLRLSHIGGPDGLYKVG